MRPLLIWFCVTIFIVLAPASARAAEIKEPAGGFAYTLPRGFKAQAYPGHRYRIAVGPIREKFAANINVLDEQFRGSIQAYSDHAYKGPSPLPEYKPLSRKAFSTKSGLKGLRISFQWAQPTVQGKLRLRVVAYLLPGKGDRKYVVTYSVASSEGAKYDKSVDAALRTFRLLQ